MRRTLLLTTAGVAVTTVVPAVAAPAPVDTGKAAETTLVVPLAHGDALKLDISAAALSGGNVVRVVSQHCSADGSCDSMDVYQSPVPASAFSVDSSTAGLTLTLAGRDVHLRWTVADGVGTSGGGDFGVGDSSVSANNYQGNNADVAASIDGASCTTTGTVGDAVAADSAAATGGQSADPLSRFRIPAEAAVGCG